MRILGISCYYHDAAACLIEDGELIAAASEERFTRIKHDAEFPENAIEFCLGRAGITAADLDYVALALRFRGEATRWDNSSAWRLWAAGRRGFMRQS